MSETMNTADNVGAQLAAETIGCRVKFNWLGASRSLDDNQQAETAALFSADVDFVKASKKLFDNKRPEFRAVNRVKNSIRHYWQSVTLPYVESGVRLLKRSSVAEFSARLEAYAAELAEAVTELDNVYSELLDEAQRRLGSLYNPADYPASLREAFSVSSDFPNLSAPDYLAQLSPELYQRERERVTARFTESVELAEQAFAAELLACVERITATLSGEVDGKPKIFRDSLVDNVNEFFERFRHLNIGSSAELESVVNQAQQALAGVTPLALRSSVHVRDMVRERMNGVQSALEAGMMNRPSRRIRIGGSEPAAAEVATIDAAAARIAAEAERAIVAAGHALAEAEQPAEQPAEPAAFTAADNQTMADIAEQITAELVEPVTASEPAPPVAEVDPITAEAEQPAEPAGVVFNLNYGGGRIRRLVVAGR